MRDAVLNHPTCKWIDVVGPSLDELREIAETYKIHPVLLEDCLDPEHLPKYEVTPTCLFMIVRAFDVHAPDDGVTVQELTRKLVLILLDGVVLTIHRSPLAFLGACARDLANVQAPTPTRIYYEICKATVMTYDSAFLAFEQRLEKSEAVIGAGNPRFDVFLNVRQEARRLSTMKRLLWHTHATFQRLPMTKDNERIYAHDLQESVQSLMFFADELAEDAAGLINLELSLNAHRNNQVIRVLTLFSVFFMPLTFIVGVYGMNFRFMPELQMRHGYVAVWAVMLVVTSAIALWFKRRGWFDNW